jgi:hypothetical protein
MMRKILRKLALSLWTRKEMQQLIRKWKQISPGPDYDVFPDEKDLAQAHTLSLYTQRNAAVD